MSLGPDIRAAAGIIKRDALVFKSYRFRFLTQALTAFFSVVLFYYISRLVNFGTFRTPDQYFAFAVVGLATFEVLVVTLTSIPGRIRQELVAGTFERLVLSPFGAVASVISLLVWPFLLACSGGILTIAFASIVFGMPLRWSTVPFALPAAFFGMLAFAPFALLTAALVLIAKQVESGVGFIATGIALIAGFFFPPELLPSWIGWASDIQPFSPALSLLRNLLVGTPLPGSLWSVLLKIALFAVVLLPLMTWALAAAIRVGQRRGTIIEY
jgi:ABC-2 type transport system permease protein